MTPHIFNLWRKSGDVPRRTRTYLLVRRKFHLFITAMLIVVLVSSFYDIDPLTKDNLPFIAGVLFLTLLAAAFFWTAVNLDLYAEKEDHPHHGSWSRRHELLKPFAIFLRKIPSVFLIAITWLEVSGLLFYAVRHKGYSFFVIQSWLLYLIVLFGASWLIQSRSSNWFIGLFLVSFSSYALAIWFSKFEDSINIILSNGSALLLVGATVHFLLRLLLEDRWRASVAEEVTRKLSNGGFNLTPFEGPVQDSELVPSLNEIATDIASRLVYDHLYIVLYDRNKGLLYLKGSNTPISDAWKKHPWSIDDPSITAWVVQNKREHLCWNTRRCDYYYGPAGIKCASEAAVPILVEGECIGAIDVESPYEGAFDPADISLLWQVANAMATALAHRGQINREIDKVYKLFERLADDLSSSETFFKALDLIVEETRISFGADLVTLYPHAVDTQLPLPYLAFSGTPLSPQYLSKRMGPNNRVLALLAERSPKDTEYYSEHADQDPLLLGPNQGEYSAEEQALYGHQYHFVKREGIKSTAFLSLAIGNNVVGSLFLNYRHPTVFNQDLRQRFKGLSAFLSLALMLKRQVERLSGPLVGVAPVSHSKAAAAFEAFRRAIKRGDDPYETVEQFKTSWAGAVLIESENLRTKTLSEGLSRLKLKVSDFYPEVKYDEDIDPIIGQFPTQFQTMIYGLVSEGVANALFHGEATEIHIDVKKQNGMLILTIENNGELMKDCETDQLNELADYPLEIYKRRSGIRALLIDARNWFGAQWKFFTTDGKTRFIVTIPYLETSPEE